MRLGEYLTKNNYITEEELGIALEEQKVTGKKLGKILVENGFISRDVLIRALSELNPSSLFEEVQSVVPITWQVQNQCLVLGISEKDKLIYYTATNGDVEEELKKFFESDYRFKFISWDVEKFFETLEKLKKSCESSCDVNEGDVNKFFQFLFEEAVNQGATDIHLEADQDVGRIRFRIDGVLYFRKAVSLGFYTRLVAYIKGRSNMDVAETRMAQDGSFSVEYRGKRYDLRVAVMPTVCGEKVSIRVLDREKAMLDIRELGLTKLDEWLSLTRMTSGLILVCGPTGSGKTTTLYSTVKYIDKLHRAVYTIEDPVEYSLPFVWQVQVNRKVGLDFAGFLRAILRHDPDVVIVGEIRDRETAEAALRLADTGHLVYATLHTTDVPSTLLRLQGLGVDFQELRFLLKAILVQRLARKICFQCRGKGCEFCFGTGYKSRTLLSEFVKIEEYQDVDKILERKKEYWTFIDDARLKISQGVTTKEEVERVLGVCVV